MGVLKLFGLFYKRSAPQIVISGNFGICLHFESCSGHVTYCRNLIGCIVMVASNFSATAVFEL